MGSNFNLDSFIVGPIHQQCDIAINIAWWYYMISNIGWEVNIVIKNGQFKSKFLIKRWLIICLIRLVKIIIYGTSWSGSKSLLKVDWFRINSVWLTIKFERHRQSLDSINYFLFSLLVLLAQVCGCFRQYPLLHFWACLIWQHWCKWRLNGQIRPYLTLS